jgi:hypothetical protein
MVHKPGLAEHDWDHVEGRPFPLQPLPEFIRFHEQVAGSSRRRRWWPWPSTRRSTPTRPPPAGHRPDRRRDRPAHRRSGPLRRRAAVGGHPGPGRGARPVSRRPHERGPSLSLTSEVDPAAVSRAVPDRPLARRRRDELGGRGAAQPGLAGAGRLRRGLPGRLLRRDARDDGVVLPLLLASIDPRRPRPRAADARPAWPRSPRAIRTRRSPTTAPPSALSTSRLHDLVGKHLGLPVHRAAGAVAGDPADRLHDRHRRARRSSPSEPRGPRASRRSRSRSAARRTSRRSRPSGASSAGPIRVDANTGWTRSRAPG